MEVNCSEECKSRSLNSNGAVPHFIRGGLSVPFNRRRCRESEFFGVQICNLEGNKILYALDDLSEDRTVAEELLKLLAVEQVEPDQATYIIEDYLGKISTIIH